MRFSSLISFALMLIFSAGTVTLYAGESPDSKRNDNSRANRLRLRKEIVHYWRQEKGIKLRDASRKLFQMALAADDKPTAAWAAHYLSRGFARTERNDSAYYYLDYAQRRYLDGIGSEQDLIVSYLESAVLLNKCDDQAKAERMAVRALALLRKEQTNMIAAAYSAISDVYMALGDYGNAGRFQKVIYQKLPGKSGEAALVNHYNLGSIFYLQGNIARAIDWLRAAESRNDLTKMPPERTITLLNRLSHCYQLQGNHKLAQQYSRRAMKYLPRLRSHEKIVTMLQHATTLTNASAAKELARKAEYLAKQSGNPKSILAVYKTMVELGGRDQQKYALAYVSLFDEVDSRSNRQNGVVARITSHNDDFLLERDSADASRKYFITLGVSIFVFFLVLGIIIFEKIRSLEAQEVEAQEKINRTVLRLIADRQEQAEELRTEYKARLGLEISQDIVCKLRQIKARLLSDTIEYDADGEFTEIARIQEVERDVRRVAHTLNGEIFSPNESFNSLLEELTQKFQERHKVKVYIDFDPALQWDEVNINVKLDVYRITEDLIRNSVQTKSSNIFLTLVEEGSNVKIILLDDGKGIDFRRQNRRAIKNILRRLINNYGFFEIKPRRAKGTTIIVTLPHRKKNYEYA